MHWLFRALTDRLRTLFVTNVALDFEAELLARQADRKSELLQKAQRLEDEGHNTVATELREQAERLSLERPLDHVLPAQSELQRDVGAAPHRLNGAAEAALPGSESESNGQHAAPSKTPGTTSRKTKKARRKVTAK